MKPENANKGLTRRLTFEEALGSSYSDTMKAQIAFLKSICALNTFAYAETYFITLHFQVETTDHNPLRQRGHIVQILREQLNAVRHPEVFVDETILSALRRLLIYPCD